MGRRGVVAVAFAGVTFGVALVFGLQWLTAPGAPVPTAPPVAVGATPAPSASSSHVGLPDHARTPGAINTAANQANLATTVCRPGWASSVRPPAAYTGALKLAQLIEYGYLDKNPSHYQEDHLVPLELGGAPRDPRNLWPEPNAILLSDGTTVGSKHKDALEDELHREVCAGAMTLDEAQRAIASDWIAAWERADRP